jgi:hypothetical protein
MIVTNRAATRAAADLDGKIDAARQALAEVDAHEAHKVADPQAMAISRLTGQTEDWVRTLLHALIAILIELGSGWGLYVVFGPHKHESSMLQPYRQHLSPSNLHLNPSHHPSRLSSAGSCFLPITLDRSLRAAGRSGRTVPAGPV